MEMKIPFNFKPREYQLPLLQAMDNGYKRAVCVWHRRSGKDKTLVNYLVKRSLQTIGVYYYFFPTYNQGRKILWDGIDRDGFKFTDHIPKEIRKRTDNTNMLIELNNGSIIQVIGTDKVDSIVGTNPVGCVFSEYSLQDPKAWGYIRPILAENGGWAIFNYTSRGRNHGHTLLEYAKSKDEWFVQVLRADETGVFTKEQLETEREQYVLEDGDDLRFMQEYMCSFDGAIQGSYYGKQISDLEIAGQITGVPYNSDLPVSTYWDLGISDAMSVWFVQLAGKEVHIIDHVEVEGEGIPYMAQLLQEKRYSYAEHWAPHDISVRELGTGKSRLEVARQHGINFRVVPNIPIIDGIQAVRRLLPRCWFDKEKTVFGVDCLRQYHKEYDDKHKVFKNRPKHDWASHSSDSFRYLAVALDTVSKTKTNVIKPKVVTY